MKTGQGQLRTQSYQRRGGVSPFLCFFRTHKPYVQLKKESTLRTITGFDKALAISLQRVNGGMLVKVGAQDWVDQIAVGAVGLIIHPLLITASVGAMQQNNALHDVLNSIDQHIRQQQPQAKAGVPSANLM